MWFHAVAEGSTRMLIGTYEQAGEVSQRLVAARPRLEVPPPDESPIGGRPAPADDVRRQTGPMVDEPRRIALITSDLRRLGVATRLGCYRRRGCGEQLKREVLDRAWAAGVTLVTSNVHFDNIAMGRLNERLGARMDSVEDDHQLHSIRRPT